MRFLILLTLFNLVGCAGYVNRIHNQIDREEGIHKKRKPSRNELSRMYRSRNQAGDKRPIKNPVTYSLKDGGPSSHRMNTQSQGGPNRRYNANDFRDNGTGGSLWVKPKSTGSLFTFNSERKPGDIVIINVLEDLRNKISSELKTAFPEKKKDKKDSEKSKDGTKAANSPPGGGQDNDIDVKVYDKVSGTIIEKVNQDYVIVRGKKNLIFRKKRHSVEIQALISKKDIMEDDHINSDKILESRVYILR